MSVAPPRLRPLAPSSAVLRARLSGIERDLDARAYRPGPWEMLTRDVRRLPAAERAALSPEISRVSRKLHLRAGRRTHSAAAGLMLEFAAILLGTIALGAGILLQSSAAIIIGTALWMAALQPVIKIVVGGAFGIDHEYFYLRVVEPRFKMAYGTYLAAPWGARLTTHCAGMIGSPLAALAGYLLAVNQVHPLTLAATVCLIALWVLIAVNLLCFLLALGGVRRIGPLRMAESSGGCAAIELREGLGWSGAE